MVNAQKSTRLALRDRLKMEKFQLFSAQIVCCQFGEAASVSIQYNELQAQLKKGNPDMQYVRCYAHALNLVMTDATERCKVANYFLGLLHSTATFISESLKRIQIWTKVNKESASGQQLLH